MKILEPRSYESKDVEDRSTVEVVRDAFEDARELVRLEVELAKKDLIGEARAAGQAADAFGVAAGCAVLVVAMLALALVLATGASAGLALVLAALFLLIAIVAGMTGYTLLPRKPLRPTRERLEADLQQMKRRMA
jgi:hypothetical protein